jgi:hypothetical protein
MGMYIRQPLLNVFSSIILAVAGVFSPVIAEIFYAQDEAIERAFPEATTTSKKTFIVTSTLAEKLKAEHKVPISQGIVTYHQGFKDGVPLGYAIIDTGIVRTHQAVFMIVLKPNGDLQDVFVLAFHEPPEYIPHSRWLKQLEGKKLTDPLIAGKDVAGIMGSTLSVQSILTSVRRTRVLFSLVAEK